MSPAELRLWRLAERQHWVVGLRQLKTLGFTDAAVTHLISDGRLYRLHRGTYAVGNPRTSVRGRWMAAVIAVGSGVLPSRGGGAVGAEDERPEGDRRDCDRQSRRRRRGITVHVTRDLHPDDCTKIDGIPVTSLARTLLDLAEVVSPTQLHRAFEEAERLQILDMRSIHAVLERSNGRRGAAKLRALLDYDPSTAAQTRSELERLFLDFVRARELPPPSVNVMVAGYEVDAYWRQAKLVIELDSYSHHGHRSAFERDRTKQAELRLAGYEVLRLTHHKLTREAEWVAATILRFLDGA
jgi:very-short-patch-repair endonuclease